MRYRAVRPINLRDRPVTGSIPGQRVPIRAADSPPAISGTSALQELPEHSGSRQVAEPQVRKSEYWLQQYRRRLIGTDAAAIVLSVLLAHALAENVAQSLTSWLLAMTLVIGWFVALVLGGVWDAMTIDAGAAAYRRILSAGTVLCLVTGVIGYFTGLELARSYLLIALPAGTAGLLLAHWGWRLRLLRHRRSGTHLRSVLVVGERVSAGVLCATIRDNPAAGYQVAGVFLLRDRMHKVRVIDDVADYPVLGNTLATGNAAARAMVAAEVIAAAAAGGASAVALADDPDQLLQELVVSLPESGIGLLVAPNLVDLAGPALRVDESAPELHWVRDFDGSRPFGKSAFDVIVASLGLVLLSPLMLAAAVAVLMSDGGPVIQRTNYVGLAGVEFPGWSFRCTPHGVKARPILRTATDENSGYVLATTPVGGLLRRCGLDEAPRLINVLMRQMSLVGPKPSMAEEVNARPIQVRPGVTGRWKVTPGSAVSSRDDCDAVNWSARADIAIIAKTLRLGLAGRLAG